jgi:DNA-binding MarR family transcriptional regulator
VPSLTGVPASESRKSTPRPRSGKSGPAPASRIRAPGPTSRTKLAADAWGALLQVHAELVPILDRQLRTRTALPLAWYDVLLELSAAPDRQLTMTELSERVVLSRTRISRVVDELTDAGLVRRQPNPADARSAFAVLTSDGLKRFREAAPIYLSAIEQQFAAALSDDDLRAVGSALARVRERSPDVGHGRR